MHAERVSEPHAHHGEGPVFHPGWPGRRRVNMHAGDVLTLDQQSGRVTRSHVGSFAAALRPRRDGGAVLALKRGFALADDNGRLNDHRFGIVNSGCNAGAPVHAGDQYNFSIWARTDQPAGTPLSVTLRDATGYPSPQR